MPHATAVLDPAALGLQTKHVSATGRARADAPAVLGKTVLAQELVTAWRTRCGVYCLVGLEASITGRAAVRSERLGALK